MLETVLHANSAPSRLDAFIDWFTCNGFTISRFNFKKARAKVKVEGQHRSNP
jgi:hypothetical protein